MFTSMRRKPQQLEDHEVYEILTHNNHGVLALLSEDGYPYAVPLNYVIEDNKLYFHAAKVGHKIDAIQHCQNASFCVVDQSLLVGKERTTYYKSVITFGKVSLIHDKEAKYHAIDYFTALLDPTLSEQERKDAILPGFEKVEIIVFEIEHLTGKQAKHFILPESNAN